MSLYKTTHCLRSHFFIYCFSIVFIFHHLFCFFVHSDLASLELQIKKELEMINIPADSWLGSQKEHPHAVLDVAIIGGGMGGLTTGFALLNEGVNNIKIFDENDSGKEGPWVRYARMNVLRSDKTDLGPSLGIPSLTFWAWYAAQYGEESWERLRLIPTKLWNDYLCWFKSILNLPVENNITLKKIIPENQLLKLVFEKNGIQQTIFARKIVLATGRDGAGGFETPEFMKDVPSQMYAHTAQEIDPDFFIGKTIVIVGGGASAFDAAATALEHGSKAVHMLIRRETLPTENKFCLIGNAGAAQGFYFLKDEQKWKYVADGMESGIPLPKETLERVKNYPNLHVHYSTSITQITHDEASLQVFTNQNKIDADFIVMGTGFEVNPSLRPELAEFHDKILLWKSRISPKIAKSNDKLGYYPYLGPHFEFLEAEPGEAIYLKNIYCFNFGAFLSHGFLGSDISLNTLGAKRLVEGIIIDLYISDQ